MRELTKKQKRILDLWFNKHKNELQAGICFFQLDKCDFFSNELYEKLEKIHDTEILYQSINRYISDKGMNATYNNKPWLR